MEGHALSKYARYHMVSPISMALKTSKKQWFHVSWAAQNDQNDHQRLSSSIIVYHRLSSSIIVYHVYHWKSLKPYPLVVQHRWHRYWKTGENGPFTSRIYLWIWWWLQYPVRKLLVSTRGYHYLLSVNIHCHFHSSMIRCLDLPMFDGLPPLYPIKPPLK